MNRETLQELLAIGTLLALITKRKKIRVAIAILADLVHLYDASRSVWYSIESAVERNEPITMQPADAARIAALGRVISEIAK